MNYEAIPLPVIQGKESTGANSLDIYDNGNASKAGKRMIIVGGDFSAPNSTEKNCFYTLNKGKTWKTPKVPPHGYRSCVEYLSQKDIIACGLNGVDYSDDGGKTWKWISKEGFHSCRIARNGSAFFPCRRKRKSSADQLGMMTAYLLRLSSISCTEGRFL